MPPSRWSNAFGNSVGITSPTERPRRSSVRYLRFPLRQQPFRTRQLSGHRQTEDVVLIIYLCLPRNAHALNARGPTLPFTEEQRAAWLAAKRAGMEHEFDPGTHTAADFEDEWVGLDDDVSIALECLHCGCSFSSGEGSIGEEAVICDTCNGA